MRNNSFKILIIALISTFIISSCEEDDQITKKKTIETGTVTDIDGNTYKTVVIGNQEWMAENLKTTTYNDGTTIALVSDASSWDNLTTGAFCWYNNNESEYAETYGALYNWYAVETGNLCPDGWRVPTDDDFTTFKNYIDSDGHNENVGTALKADHGWTNEGNGTDNYEFKALPAGIRFGTDGFLMAGACCYYWSSTVLAAEYIKMWSLSYSGSDFYRGNYTKDFGLSIRCIKDK